MLQLASLTPDDDRLVRFALDENGGAHVSDVVLALLEFLDGDGGSVRDFVAQLEHQLLAD